MKKPIPKIRVFGQRSIDSSFLNRSSIPVEGSLDNTSKKKVENCVSFSNFLDSKLSKSVLFKPKNIEERPRPFTSLVSAKDLTQLSNGFGVERKAREEKKNGDGGLEKMMLQQFKPREIQISEEVSRDVPGEVSLESLEQTVEESSDNTSKKVENCVSFSNFLDSKLNNSVLSKPKNIEEKPRLFTSLVSSKDLTQLSHGFGVERKAREEKKNGDGGLEKMMLQQFKPSEIQISEEVSSDIPGEVSLEPLEQTADEETDNMASNSDEINEGIIVKDDKISKKRKDPFEGMESMTRTGKSVIVFGDNSKVSKPMQREKERGSNNNSKKQRSTYNHYANGSGWWDCDMEGVDSEEVGHSEVWEGVGSTTFGDIVDWR